MKHLLIITLVLFLFSTCKKEVELPFSITPNISIVNVSPTTIVQFKDSIAISISYTDGDGDLGHDNADSLICSVKDARLTKADNYYIPPLAPLGSNISIKGQLTIYIKNTFLLGNGNTETTNFEIQVHDRAGHYSNITNTGNITINR